MNKFIFVIFFLCPFYAYSQAPAKGKFSFGLQFLFKKNIQSPKLIILDSVVVESQNDDELGAPILGIYAEKQVTNSLGLRVEINYVNLTASSYLIYDLKPDKFGLYYYKSKNVFSPSIQVPIIIALKIPFQKRVSILAGIDNHFQFRKFYSNLPYSWDKFYPHRDTDVINNLDYIPRSYVPFYIIGFKLDLERITFSARHEENFSKSYTRNLVIGDKSYPFITHQSYYYFTLGYRFYSLKIKKKNKERYTLNPQA